MDENTRDLACFHCGSDDELPSYEQCDCDGVGRRQVEDSFVDCELCDHNVCGDCLEWLHPISMEKEGLDHERD